MGESPRVAPSAFDRCFFFSLPVGMIRKVTERLEELSLRLVVVSPTHTHTHTRVPSDTIFTSPRAQRVLSFSELRFTRGIDSIRLYPRGRNISRNMIFIEREREGVRYFSRVFVKFWRNEFLEK